MNTVTPQEPKSFKTMKIWEIAEIIRADWKNMAIPARPYIMVMRVLDSVSDKYGADSGKSIVSYFLANAQSWKGEVAREIKKELNSRIK